jgi:hypothetical protein
MGPDPDFNTMWIRWWSYSAIRPSEGTWRVPPINRGVLTVVPRKG